MSKIYKQTTLSCSIVILALMITMSSLHFAHVAMLLLSFAFFNLYMSFGKHRRLSLSGLFNTLVFIFFALISVLFYIANYFTGNGVTFDVLSHLNGHSFSAAFYAFETYQKIALLIIALFGVIYFVSPQSRQSKGHHAWLYTVSLLLMFGLHPLVTTSVKLFYQLGMSESSEVVLQIIEDNRLSDGLINQTRETLNTQPNVLLIYLESMERTYFDDRYYQNLMTDLEGLSKQALDFTNVSMPWGATHTIAGMVASLCGVPINAPRGGMHQDGSSDVYMPKAQCLGDITRKLGYFNLFYQGANLDFSNKGGFMRSHGFDEVKGRKELLGPAHSESDVGPWGIHDDILLEKVKTRLETLFNSDRDKPFFFTMLTLDTHDAFGDNRVSKWCDDEGPGVYQDADHDIQHAVYCSDKLMSQFIRQIKDQWGDDLLIVMINDHGAYPFNVGKKLKIAEKEENRRLLFSFIDGDAPPEIVSRSLSSLDLGATVLGYITSNKLNTIGLGTSAFDEQSTNLLEQQGMQALNRTLMSSNFSIGKSLWVMSSFKDADISIDPAASSLTIAGNKYTLPVALMLDNNGRIIDFYGKDVRDKVSLLKASQRLVWAGECQYIDEMVDVQGKTEETCLFISNLAKKEYFLTELSEPKVIRYQDYETLLQGRADFELFNDHLYKQKNSKSLVSLVEYIPTNANGDFAIIDVFSSMSTKINLVSYKGFPTMSERLTFRGRKRNHYGYPNDNGFYLFEINDGLVNQIYHWQTCSDNKDFKSINRVLKANNKAQAFILVSTRQVRCDDDNLDPYFENSPFQSAASIKTEQPYIAYWEGRADKAYAVSAPPRENIQLRLIDRELLEKEAL